MNRAVDVLHSAELWLTMHNDTRCARTGTCSRTMGGCRKATALRLVIALFWREAHPKRRKPHSHGSKHP